MYPGFLPAALLVVCATALRPAFAADLLIADFEGNDYRTWKSAGTAFRRGRARDAQLAALEIENSRWRGVASSEVEGDGPMGTLTSPEFKIERQYISFLIAGGGYEHHTWQWTMDRLIPGMRQEGWLNDLNGLIFYEGEYHLFAQRWNKCWIHAVSKDQVHWTELDPAFWEEQLDTGVQSGTCVVDDANTSGLVHCRSTEIATA